MTVKVIKMWTGEDVIADLITGDDSVVELKNPIVAIPAQQGQIGFAPWSPLVDKNAKLKVTRKYVVYIEDPQDDLVEQYNQMFGNIATPPKKLIL